MSLPDPQLIADAQSFSVFAALMSQATAKVISPDSSESDYENHKTYFKDNLPKLKTIIERLEADLA